MKRLMLLFILLFGVFLGTWAYKISKPVARPDEYAQGYDKTAGQWWNTGDSSADEDWTFDYTVPLNYIPVPGEKDLFMEVDNDGNIIAYHKRVLQADGSYNWETVNPDIPENYEPVEGLENVYKVTDADGNVRYLKYIRNEDDTYAFVEVDEYGNMLNHNTDATTIDGKHVHITGNTYSLLNDAGVVIGYEKRVQNPDGTFSWTPTEIPSISDIGNNLSLNLPAGGSLQSPGLDTSGLDAMAQQMAEANAAAANGVGDTYNITINNNGDGSANQMLQDGSQNQGENQIIQNADGTHTEVQTIRETKVIDGYSTTYETLVKKTYDSYGNLINSFQEGPYEVSKEQSITQETEGAPNPDAKEPTLAGELARVCGNKTYEESVGSEVAAKLNAERAGKGLNTLQVTETAMQIAKLRATDMCRYDTSDSNLPTYGRLADMLQFYSVTSQVPGETLWKTTERTADEINTRFSVIDSARYTRMKEGATQYGIAICNNGLGSWFVCEVIL